MENKFEIFKQVDKAAAAAEAGEYLNRLLTENKKKPILLMVSGGSALEILDFVGTTAMGENLTVSMLDDRFSEDKEINNFSQLQKTDFYSQALEAGVSFFASLPRKEDTMQTLSERWENNLKTWRKENPKGIIIAILGMGPDGHTAGIFADEDKKSFEQLFNAKPLLTAYNVGNKHQYKDRITSTITFLEKINFGIAFVCGQDKKEKLDLVIKNQGEVNELPALAWHGIKNIRIFTDINLT